MSRRMLSLAVPIFLCLPGGLAPLEASGPPHIAYNPYGLHIGGQLGGALMDRDQFAQAVNPQGKVYVTYWWPSPWGGREFDRLGMQWVAGTYEVDTDPDVFAPGTLDVRSLGLNVLISTDLNRAGEEVLWQAGWHTYFGTGASWYIGDFEQNEEKTQEALTSFEPVDAARTLEYFTKFDSGWEAHLEMGITRQFSKGLTLGMITSVAWVNMDVERDFYTRAGNGPRTFGQDVEALDFLSVFVGIDLGYNF